MVIELLPSHSVGRLKSRPSTANANGFVTCDPLQVFLNSNVTGFAGHVHITCGTNTLLMNFHTHTPEATPPVPKSTLLEISGFLADDDPDCVEVKLTRKGNPKTGKFPESMAFKRSDAADNETLTFDIEGFTGGQSACVVAHADLRNSVLSPPFDEAYGAGVLFDDPSNGGDNPSGATYYSIPIVFD